MASPTVALIAVQANSSGAEIGGNRGDPHGVGLARGDQGDVGARDGHPGLALGEGEGAPAGDPGGTGPNVVGDVTL